jgi:P27 family predicted phage terminase small subunit
MNNAIPALKGTPNCMRRKSTSEKRLHGTLQPSREKKRLQFETANGVAIKAPAYVRANPLAAAEWKAVAPLLMEAGVLKPAHISILANYCVTFARWRAASASVERDGQTIMVTSTTRTGKTERPVINPSVRAEILYSSALVKLGTKLGINPLDMGRVTVPEEADVVDATGRDAFDRFLDNDEDDADLAYLELPRRAK